MMIMMKLDLIPTWDVMIMTANAVIFDRVLVKKITFKFMLDNTLLMCYNLIIKER